MSPVKVIKEPLTYKTGPNLRPILSIYTFLLSSPFRYSKYFSAIQSIFSYTPQEKMLKTAMEFVAYTELDGDYLEFGVYEGHTFTSAFHFAQKYKLGSMKFYAFDSFEGLPEITGVDSNGFRPSNFDKGRFACDVNKFTENIAKKRVDLRKVTIIPGWFDKVLNTETKKKLPIKKASIIYIDCDLYKSTVPILNFITDYIQDGTVLIFDDWFCFRGNPNRGEQKAFREWLKKNPSIEATEFYKFSWHGNSFIINREE